MLAKGHYFPGQVADEEVLLFLRRHPFPFVVPWLLIIAFSSIIPIILFIILGFNAGWQIFLSRENSYYIIGLSAYLLILLAVLLSTWISWYFDVTIVTKTHLIDINQQGFFTRKVSEQSLLRVQDVSARMSGFWQTWLRFGAVFVETAGEAPNFEMHNIRKPNVVANAILRLHDELVAGGGYESMIAEGVGDLAYEGPRHQKAIPKNLPTPEELEKGLEQEAHHQEQKQETVSPAVSEEKEPLEKAAQTTAYPADNLTEKQSSSDKKEEENFWQEEEEKSDQDEGELKEGESIKL